MIRLKSVRVENDRIACFGYVEDCQEPVKISVDMKGNADSGSLPKGYEWCESYVRAAERYLLKSYEQGKLKSEMLMMWG